jgi:hypothetical protein
MTGSAQGFALQAISGLVGWRGNPDAAYLEGMHDLLAKDVIHAAELAPTDDPAMAALQAACRAMLARVQRAGLPIRLWLHCMTPLSGDQGALFALDH